MILRHRTIAARPRSRAGEASHGALARITLSEPGGLSQCGVHVDELQPGARSSDRHWHEEEDAFLLVLAGQAAVVDNDGAHRLTSGDAACWPAGVDKGHHLISRSDAPCRYPVVGWRTRHDGVHYSDIDKLFTRANGRANHTRRDGSPL